MLTEREKQLEERFMEEWNKIHYEADKFVIRTFTASIIGLILIVLFV